MQDALRKLLGINNKPNSLRQVAKGALPALPRSPMPLTKNMGGMTFPNRPGRQWEDQSLEQGAQGLVPLTSSVGNFGAIAPLQASRTPRGNPQVGSPSPLTGVELQGSGIDPQNGQLRSLVNRTAPLQLSRDDVQFGIPGLEYATPKPLKNNYKPAKKLPRLQQY